MKSKKILAAVLASTVVLSMAGCGTTGTSSEASTGSKAETTTAAASNSETTAETSGETSTSTGEKLTLTVLTHRTDRLADGGDGTLEEMTKAFEEKNNCVVKYQGYTKYSDDVSTMMSTKEYGDVLMIPDTVKLADLSKYFEPLGSFDELNEKYYWADKKMYDGNVYGIAHLGTVAGGICYNKKVWKEAGIEKLPQTADEFIADLKLIKEKTEAIPYYTNFADSSWTLNQWTSLVVSAAGDPAYENNILTQKKDLFVSGDAYNDVFKLMYDVFKDSTLHEEDPMTSDWEGCKAAMNEGKIATMVMGSWAVSQFQAAGANADDIGYMPAPFAKDGKQSAQLSADYCMGVNVNRSAEIKELGKKYITWFVEESGFAQKEGSICTLKGSDLPACLDDFKDCTLFTTDLAPEGLEGVWDTINNDSQVGLWAGDAANFKIKLAEAAFAGKGDDEFTAIMKAENEKWNTTRDANELFKAYIAKQN